MENYLYAVNRPPGKHLDNYLVGQKIFLDREVIDKLLSKTFGRHKITLVKLNSAYDYKIS
jgi:hypothetical protein